MRKRIVRTIALILSFTIMYAASYTSFATENTGSSQESVSDAEDSKEEEAEKKRKAKEEKQKAVDRAQAAYEQAQKEKEQLEGALANAEALVNDLKTSKKNTEDKIKGLDSQLSTITAHITLLEQQMTNKEAEIAIAEDELAITTAKTQAQYEAMKLRIKYIYESGNTNYINIIFSAKDMSALLNSVDYINMLSTYDRNMLVTYQELVEYQEQVKTELEAEYASLETMRESVGVEKQTVQVLKDAKSAELASIGEDLDDAQEVAKAYEQEVQTQIEVLNQIKAQLEAAKNSLGEETNYLANSSGVFQWPCPSYTRIPSEYGPRVSPTKGASTDHKGIDLAAPYGSDILAAESGVVIVAKYNNSAGNYVVVKHGTNSDGDIVCSVYMHASSLNVSEGQEVSRGQVIAKVGSTGYSTGNHLHFGVTVGGSYVNPWGYL